MGRRVYLIASLRSMDGVGETQGEKGTCPRPLTPVGRAGN